MSSGGQEVSPSELQKCMAILLEQMVHLHKNLFKSLLQNVPSLIKEFMMLSPADASQFMHAVNMTWADRRRCSLMFQKLLQVPNKSFFVLNDFNSQC